MNTGLTIFDTTVQESNEWLKCIEDELPPCDRQQAYAAMRAVLHVLRDRLPTEAVLGLSAQLPMLLRGVFLEGWRPNGHTSGIRVPQEFAEAVADRCPHNFPREPTGAICAVFAVLAEHLAPGEVSKIINHLPIPLRIFWPPEYRAT